MKPKRFLRVRQVTEVTGLPPSSIYDEVKKGRFPKQVPIGPHRVAWIEDEIEAWQQARISERDI